MIYMLRKINKLAKNIYKETGKRLIGVRVFHNALLLYFIGGKTQFYSKKGQDWGEPNTIYFVTEQFNRCFISKRLLEQYEARIDWTENWIKANIFKKIWLVQFF